LPDEGQAFNRLILNIDGNIFLAIPPCSHYDNPPKNENPKIHFLIYLPDLV
jgi:hypothetical protein